MILSFQMTILSLRGHLVLLSLFCVGEIILLLPTCFPVHRALSKKRSTPKERICSHGDSFLNPACLSFSAWFPFSNLSTFRWILFKFCVHMFISCEWFGAVMGKFCQFWTDHTSVLTFPDDNLSECQWIVTKLGLCIDIMEIWVEIVNRQISSMLTYICPPHDSDGILSFHVLISLK